MEARERTGRNDELRDSVDAAAPVLRTQRRTEMAQKWWTLLVVCVGSFWSLLVRSRNFHRHELEPASETEPVLDLAA
jgi:hypothetical protein